MRLPLRLSGKRQTTTCLCWSAVSSMQVLTTTGSPVINSISANLTDSGPRRPHSEASEARDNSQQTELKTSEIFISKTILKLGSVKWYFACGLQIQINDGQPGNFFLEIYNK